MSQSESSNATLSELRKFLMIRGIGEEAIQRMEDDKIDLEVLSIITDDKLKTYLPQYGDRIAVISFARREKARHTEAGTAADRKRLLAETLKAKMSSRHFTRSQKLVGNIHAKKQDRRVEVGWVDFNELNEYKQVKAPSGGGTKHATFSLESSLSVVLDQAKLWFFPNGKSRRGLLSQFDFFITDTTQIPIDEKLTVGEMYDKQKAKILRMYIASKKKCVTNSSQGLESTSQKEDSNSFQSVEAIPQNSIDIPEIKKPKRRKITCSRNIPNLPATPEAEEPVAKVRVESTEDIASSLFPANEYDPANYQGNTPKLPATPEAEEPIAKMRVESTEDIASSLFPANEYDPANYQGNTPKLPATPEVRVESTEDIASSQYPTNEYDPANYQMILDEDGTCSLMLLQEPVLTSPNIGHTDATTYMDTDSSRKTTAILHRANIINEMIGLFVDPQFLEAEVLFKFHNEAAADASGVSREAYSTFWDEFYLTHTSGETERVPALSPEFGLDEWSAVGRILAKGYKEHGLLPSRLSPAFLIAVVHSEHAVSPEMLISSYKTYLSHLDADVISKAISGSMDEADKDDLLDILGRADCHIIPDADNMVETIRNAAHKELIQEPSYALDAMTVVARTILLPLMPTVEDVLNVYEVRKPNPRKVINLIESNPNNVSQEKVLGYLKQYIRGLDSKTLKKFLRYCTGSESLCFGKLMVEFNAVKRGAGRFPIAHTCGPTLELPDSYLSYNELRAELSCILDSGYLRMDVV